MHEPEVVFVKPDDTSAGPVVEYVIDSESAASTHGPEQPVTQTALTPEQLEAFLGSKRNQMKAIRRYVRLAKREASRAPMKAKKKTANRKKNATAKASRKRNR